MLLTRVERSVIVDSQQNMDSMRQIHYCPTLDVMCGAFSVSIIVAHILTLVYLHVSQQLQAAVELSNMCAILYKFIFYMSANIDDNKGKREQYIYFKIVYISIKSLMLNLYAVESNELLVAVA